MKRLMGICLLFILFVMASTNPNKQTYVDWAKEAVIQQSGDTQLLTMALFTIAGDKADTLIENNTTNRNLIFFSIYETNLIASKVQVIGILGNFYPISNETSNALKVK